MIDQDKIYSKNSETDERQEWQTPELHILLGVKTKGKASNAPTEYSPEYPSGPS